MMCAFMSVALTGCGGGGNEAMSDPGSGTAYAFHTPTVNATRHYSETVTDNSGDMINIGFTTTVTAVNADGTSPSSCRARQDRVPSSTEPTMP